MYCIVLENTLSPILVVHLSLLTKIIIKIAQLAIKQKSRSCDRIILILVKQPSQQEALYNILNDK